MAVDRVERRSGGEGADIFDLPTVRLRGRNVLALVLAPEYPMSDWFAAFDRQLNAAPGFFADRPIVADLRAAVAEGGPQAIGLVLDTLSLRDLKLIGVEGVEARHLAGTPGERLATRLHGRDTAVEAPDAEAAPDSPAEPETPAQTSLLIDRPVRSGQSVVFAEGDVTVVGSVSSGAEVLAGGSIHVYGTLRGRAIAGLRAGSGARIFCRKLEAELVGVDQLYRTAEHWGPGLHGRAVQVLCDRGSLRLSAFD
jgi:septum site-determining protein MinC